jgi:HAD superfamily hydrolase (TIGR01509 family)
MSIQGLIFDVDGTLAETEELHRRAFNDTFKACGLDWHWDRALYRQLLQTAGGKERIAAFIEGHVPHDGEKVAMLIGELHALKTERYAALVRTGAIDLRPGIARLVGEAKAAGVRLAIATTTSLPNVYALLDATLGKSSCTHFSVIAAGDEVGRKKPCPDVYRLALARLDLPASACVAIEDSRNGLLAARAAQVHAIVTPSMYTIGEDFREAMAVLTALGEPTAPYQWLGGEGLPNRYVTIELMQQWLRLRRASPQRRDSPLIACAARS